MNFTKEEKAVVRQAMEFCGLKVHFNASKYGVKMDVSGGKDYTSLKDSVNDIMERLRVRGLINYKECYISSGGGSEMRFNVMMRDRPVKTTIDRINTEKYNSQPNKFGQTPEIGDYVIGNKSGKISTIFMAEVLGWDRKSLIVKNIMGYGQPGDIETMRWRENMVFPKDIFKEDLHSFLVMMRLAKGD